MEEVSLFFIVSEGVRIFRKASPFKEGHLRNSVKETQTGRREHTISIGGEEAPYAVFTNEVWVAPYWNGKKNPNEHWIDNAVEDFVDYICEKTGGKLVKFSGIDDRWSNKSYWESEEGKERLKRYGINDYKSAVSRAVTVEA